MATRRRPSAAGVNLPEGQVPAKRLLKAQHVTDHLANERTFLAWIRTAVGIITLGFVVSKFGLYLRELAQSTHSIEPSSSHSEIVGFILVALGVVMVLAALLRYLRNQRLIDEESYRPARSLDIILAVLVAVGGVVMFVLLLTSV